MSTPSNSVANNTNNGVASNTDNSVASSNGTATNSVHTNTTIRFSNSIVDAMKYVQQGTKMPLFAPTLPTFQPNAKAISVEAASSPNDYSVDLYSTAQALPMNDPSLAQLGPNADVATFAGQSYTSATQAMQALQAVRNDFPIDQTKSGVKVDLGSGITGRMYPYKADNVPSGYSVTEWHEGKWTIDVYGMSSDMKNEIKRVVSYLHVNFLPMTTGVMQVNPPAANGPSTSLTWVFGSNMYMSSARDSMTAMELAVSMREYPSYRIIP